MVKSDIACILLGLPMIASAAGGGRHVEHVDADISNQASVQRGAK